MSTTVSRRLGTILVDAKVLAPPSLARALDRQRGSGKRLGAVLVESGLLDEETIVAALGVQRDLPVVDLRRRAPDPDAVAELPEEVARELSAAPIRKTAHGLEVAVSEPLGGPALAQLENFVGGPVVMLLAPADEVGRMIERSYPHVRIPSPLESQEPADGLARPESPGHIVLQAIVSRALRAGASDIHIDVRPIGARVEGHRLAGTVRRGQREVNRFDMTVDGRRLRVVVTAFMADN